MSRLFITAVQVAALVYEFNEHFFQLQVTAGPSMLPTLDYTGEIVLLNKWSGKFARNCKVGDLVVATKPSNAQQSVCKRILGMPGDTVFVDPTISDKTIKVPVGHVWLAGDNVVHSLDSRSYGPVPFGLVTAKVIARVWPKPTWFLNGLQDEGPFDDFF
ncbi:inner membrane peptidase complex catalytic subunit [Schizosaccharomyces japonicus yFS275]|uniref:Inner membrane peptidase complex catalytic subunit n=1 Tax=Schizosaccharomyces japonicus (strain yFS275 / FY16936) TaxID=402676 RepID=B6K4T5_SCHJY|nr:inner membrane peptidase complex catalytic subunit [Schizosaccharomyces japonicus yFS275]EEB08492.1 inner membrane peptidase complex catalytic subunit [Schizosaccharomyces japonicus yFS275]